jgi:hypothetical protein
VIGMPAFRFFDPWAENTDEPLVPAKVANPAEAEIAAPETLAALAGAPADPVISGAKPDPAAPTDLEPATCGQAEDERAAIVQHDGGIPRAWAEGFAQLDPNRPPSHVPPKRWRRFIDDAGLFLKSPFCAAAAALGWGPHDLFGCDRNRPFARIDQAGLLWLLDGAQLVALTENAAIIKTRIGAPQTWRRRPNEPWRVLAWELGHEPRRRPERAPNLPPCGRSAAMRAELFEELELPRASGRQTVSTVAHDDTGGMTDTASLRTGA